MTERASIDNQFVVEAVRDDEAEVWVAESDQVTGLITEAGSRAHLFERLTSLIPELLELNHQPFDPHKSIDIVSVLFGITFWIHFGV